MRAPNTIGTKRGCTIVHSELLTLVQQTAQSDYVTYRFLINPGLQATFPWLSKVASNYEMYYVRKLHVEYRTRTGFTTNGTVLMYPDYDPKDTAAVDYKSAATMDGAVSDAPYKPLRLVLKVPSMMRNAKKYVRSSGPIQGDQSLYDAGSINISLKSETGSTLMGEVWIHYVVDLISPQTSTLGSAPISGSKTIYKPSVSGVGLSDDVDTPGFVNSTPEHDDLNLGPTDASGNVTIPTGADGKYKITTFGDFQGPDSVNVGVKNLVNAGVQWISDFTSQDDFGAGTNYTQSAGDYILELFAGDILQNVVRSTDLIGTLGGTLFDSASWAIEMIEPFAALLTPLQLQQRKERALAERKTRQIRLEQRELRRREAIAQRKARATPRPSRGVWVERPASQAAVVPSQQSRTAL